MSKLNGSVSTMGEHHTHTQTIQPSLKGGGEDLGILGLLSNNRDDKEEGDNSIRLYRGKLDKLGKIQVLSVYSLERVKRRENMS